MNTIVKFLNKLRSFYYFVSNNCMMKDRNMSGINYNKKVYVCTLAWGEYLDWYFSYSLLALIHESNLDALIKDGYEVKFVLYTTDNKEEIIKKYIKGNSNLKNQNIEVVEFKKHNSNKARKTAVYQVLDILDRCLRERAVFFHAPPDCIFGNGSLYNSVTISFEKKKCFASALPRVSVDVLNEITPYPKQGIKNSELVGLCMKFPHDSFKYANEKLSENSTHLGVSFRKLSNELYSVTHNLPSAYLIFPVKEDYDYFNNVQDFNMWDRGWLNILIRTNRLKISGSSDVFFLMEITNIQFDKKDGLINNQMYNDQVTNPEFQHKITSMFTSVWRSSS